MKNVQNKLKSRSGVTLIITIVFMLFCVMVGGSILTAATVNAGRVRQTAAQDQTYLSQRSAATLLEQELCAKGEFRLTVRPEGSPVLKVENTENTLRELVCYCAWLNYCEHCEIENFSVDLSDSTRVKNVPDWWWKDSNLKVKVASEDTSVHATQIAVSDAGVTAYFTVQPEVPGSTEDNTVYCKLFCDGETQKTQICFVDEDGAERDSDGKSISQMHIEFTPSISKSGSLYVALWDADKIKLVKGGIAG